MPFIVFRFIDMIVSVWLVGADERGKKVVMTMDVNVGESCTSWKKMQLTRHNILSLLSSPLSSLLSSLFLLYLSSHILPQSATYNKLLIFFKKKVTQYRLIRDSQKRE